MLELNLLIEAIHAQQSLVTFRGFAIFCVGIQSWSLVQFSGYFWMNCVEADFFGWFPGWRRAWCVAVDWSSLVKVVWVPSLWQEIEAFGTFWASCLLEFGLQRNQTLRDLIATLAAFSRRRGRCCVIDFLVKVGFPCRPRVDVGTPDCTGGTLFKPIITLFM